MQLRWSRKTTWIGSLAVALAVGVAALTSVSSERLIGDLDEQLHAQIATYSALLPDQLASAVAHGDREAARRTLDVLAADTDVVAVTLRDSRGHELYRAGAPGPWQPEDIVATQLFESDDRVTAAIRVPGSPGGLLTLELSTGRVRNHRRIAVWTAIIAGTAALLFGVATRRLIARSVVHQLREIVEVAAAVEDGAGAPAPEQPHDEIALFGNAFHRMLTRLRRDQLRLRSTVSELTVVKDELARANGELEARVALRTGELSESNRQLHAEMSQRSQIEVELRQAQKLESVGRLASGIAHEINTPVQFVSDSCTFLDTATADLIAVIKGHRTALAEVDRGATTAAAASQRIRALEAERDVGYLIEQIPLAIKRALGGLERVAVIVRAMKDFAYPDHKAQAPADLNRAILSTLTVARNEYKYVAEVRTELGELPLVTCHVGELNQVILNMVVNAAHAIAEGKAEREGDGLIVVRTRALGAQVAIEIEDNGCGIPASAFDKIFDPFFTTKEIGKGTGQGLAIAHAVVIDKHAGKVDVASQVGHGTTFTITLPVHGRDSAAADTAAAGSPDVGEPIASPDDSIERGQLPPTGPDRETA